MNEIDLLFLRLKEIENYPLTMDKIHGEFLGASFFPGGRGVIGSGEKISDKEFMILGQDWGTCSAYDKAVKSEKSINSYDVTWNNLKRLLEKCKIEKSNCFFTNAIMGVRKEGPITGTSPAFKDKEFIINCQDFFLYQIEVQKPKYIFVLGKAVAKFLAKTSPQLSVWGNIPNYRTIDERENQIISDVTFNNNIKSNLVLLMHPSCRIYNLDKRVFNDKNGEDAHVEMIKEMMRHVENTD